MPNLQHIQSELKNSLVEGPKSAIKLLEEKLLRESPHFNSFIHIKSRSWEYENDIIHGTAPKSELSIIHAQLITSIMYFIERLNLSDLKVVEDQTDQAPLPAYMKKTILFLASEIDSATPAQCNGMYKVIYKALKKNRLADNYYILKWDQPTGEELIDLLESNPEYIHYCGHGGEDGAFQVFSEEGRVYSFNSELLEKYLQRNPNLECLFMGSYGSDKLIEQLKHLADFNIGFKNMPTPEFVNKFYEVFYSKLFEFGSPIIAFLRTRDFLVINKIKIGGAQPIFRSKINHIMEKIVLSDQKQFEQEKIIEIEGAIDSENLELESLDSEARQIFLALLKKHPYPIDVFWFYSTKAKLAHVIAQKVKITDDPITRAYFEKRLLLSFEIFEKILINFEQGKEVDGFSKKILSIVLKGEPEGDFINAFKLLIKNDEVKNRTLGFQLLLSNSIQYVIEIFPANRNMLDSEIS